MGNETYEGMWILIHTKKNFVEVMTIASAADFSDAAFFLLHTFFDQRRIIPTGDRVMLISHIKH